MLIFALLLDLDALDFFLILNRHLLCLPRQGASVDFLMLGMLKNGP